MKARENAVSEPAGQTPLEAICWTHTLDFSTGFFYEGHKYDSRDVKVREASVIKASSEMSPDVEAWSQIRWEEKKIMDFSSRKHKLSREEETIIHKTHRLQTHDLSSHWREIPNG